MSIFAPLNAPLAPWPGRRVWLVGATSGIGLAAAGALHGRGAQVCISGRSQRAIDEFTRTHPGSAGIAVDCCDTGQVRAAAQKLLAEGPLDLVVYCAGHFREMSAAAFDLEEMLKHQDVNYAGALRVLDAVLPAMLDAGRGHVSLVASVAGYRGLPRSVGYGPTKAALIHLAEAMYLDLRPRAIGVSVVCPGFVDTPLTAQNRFRMPALITASEAAAHMLRGWERGRFEIHFPRRFSGPMKLLAALPFRLYQAVVRRGTGL